MFQKIDSIILNVIFYLEDSFSLKTFNEILKLGVAKSIDPSKKSLFI